MTAVPINNNFLSLSDAQSPQRHISMDFFFFKSRSQFQHLGTAVQTSSSEAGGSLNVCGQPRLHSETLSQNKTE